MRAWAAPALLLLLGACRTAGTGESTMTAMAVPGGTPSAVADLLVRAMLNRGYQVRTVDGRQALFAKPADAEAGSMLVGADASGSPETRVRYDIANVKGGVHVTAIIQLVSNPGTKYEHASLPNGGDDFQKVQEILAAVRDRIAKHPPRPSAAPEPAKAAEKPEKKAKAKKTEPPPDDKPSPRAPGAGDEDMIEQMRKRVLGSGNK